MKQFAALLFLVLFSYDGLMAQPGKPEYCIPSANCSFGDGISDFIFAGISNHHNGCSPEGYGDFTTMQATAETGKNYIASFRSSYADQRVSLWIDLNNDSEFSDAECLISDLMMTGSGKWYNAAVTIPQFINPGIYRLRIGANWMGPSSPDPCAAFSYGEWEDYQIQITSEPVQTNVAVVSIDMPQIMPVEVFTPWGTLYNQGADTAGFWVYIREAISGYESRQYVWKLLPGEFRRVRFDTLLVGPGVYNFYMTSELEGDEIPGDDSLAMMITFSDQPRQKVIAEFFTGTWNTDCTFASEGLDLLKQEYTNTLAVIAWHIGDTFEIPEGPERGNWYRTAGYPTVWFDGWKSSYGAYYPNNYLYFRPYMNQRIPHPSNFEISVVLSEISNNTLRANATVEILQGNSDENLAAFVVLTESGLPAPGLEKQNFVARKIYPDISGLPLDFSTQTVHSWNTDIVIEPDYDIENCEIVVFIQNMDTKEIYQGTSRMADDITGLDDPASRIGLKVYPNPAGDFLTIRTIHKILNVSAFNSMGQKVYEVDGSENVLNFNTADFESGMYFFRVQTIEGVFTATVVIE